MVIVAADEREAAEKIQQIKLAFTAFRAGWNLAQSGNFESLEQAELVFQEMLEPTIGAAAIH